MSDIDVPKTWIDCFIGEVTQIVNGGTPPSKDPDNFTDSNGIPWITPADLSGYRKMYIHHGARNLTEQGFTSCSANFIAPGSVLYSSRAPIGYTVIAANEVTTNQGFKSFVLPSGLDSRFVYYYLRHITPLAISRATGTTFKELSAVNAAKLPLLVAPYLEQKRIADKLDLLLARVDACRERLDRVPALIKRFRQGVLDAATSGRLTEEWREFRITANADYSNQDTELPSTWGISRIGEQFKLIDGDRGTNYPKQTDYLEAGPCLFLSTKNVRPFGFLFNEVQFISNEKHQTLRSGTLLRGDVVLTTRGTLGNVAVYDQTIPFEQVRINSGMLILRPSSTIQSHYAAIYIASPLFTSQLANNRSGSAQPQIPAGVLKEFWLPVPSLSEQAEIVRRVDILFAFADNVEARLQSARDAVERLTPALLDKAFRGELVPQDPKDEPASVLLERLRTVRTNMDVSRPKKVKVSRKPMSTQITPASVLEAINQLPDDGFVFDDVRKIVSGDYDTLKNAFFKLLSGSEPDIQQVFDKERREMRFLRTGQGG